MLVLQTPAPPRAGSGPRPQDVRYSGAQLQRHAHRGTRSGLACSGHAAHGRYSQRRPGRPSLLGRHDRERPRMSRQSSIYPMYARTTHAAPADITTPVRSATSTVRARTRTTRRQEPVPKLFESVHNVVHVRPARGCRPSRSTTVPSNMALDCASTDAVLILGDLPGLSTAVVSDVPSQPPIVDSGHDAWPRAVYRLGYVVNILRVSQPWTIKTHSA